MLIINQTHTSIRNKKDIFALKVIPSLKNLGLLKFNQSEEKSEKLNGGEQKLSNGDLADVEVAGNDDPERAAWGGKIEFILTCVG